MIIEPIKTKKLIPPKDDLFAAIRSAIKKIPERSVFVVTSKVVSIHEGRCVPVEDIADKDDLIKAEADFYIPRDKKMPWVMHTIKHNLFIPTAGIDESNANGHYILWPKNPKRSARLIYTWLRATYRLKECGVIITDSRSAFLRRGVLGTSLSHYGFIPLKDYRNTLDLFGRELHVTQSNIPDAIAAASVLAMGEGAEQTPLAIVTGLSSIIFQDKPARTRKQFSSFEISPKDDLYAPLFSGIRWHKGGGGKRKEKKRSR